MNDPNFRQQERLDQLVAEYRSVKVRPDSHSLSVYADCYDVSTPERCVRCGDDGDHLSAHYDHPFWVVAPVATFRISPSGFTQRIDPVEAAA